MKWLILLTLFACNTQTQTPTEEVKTDEAVSCVCNKIFEPVCAQGRTFPNSCEAECQGFKDWKAGSCE